MKQDLLWNGRVLSFPCVSGYSFPMSTITAILEPDADGTLHLPLPPDMPRGKVKVTVTVEAVGDDADWPVRRERALAAFQRLRARGGIKSIPDPVAWQREQRQDRSLPGREE